jgi:YVTN family beta-propeller protein
MPEQPTGTVTLLFSDIEGSTGLLRGLGRDRYSHEVEVYRGLLREIFARHGAYEVDSEGDAFFVVFRSAAEAVAAAGEAQRVLNEHDWPEGHEIRVRMGVHTGEPLVVPPRYVGLDVHRAARIMAAGHGGQALVSETTERLVSGDERVLQGLTLLDRGRYRLKDFEQGVRLYEVVGSDLPGTSRPLRADRLSPPKRRRLAIGLAVLALAAVSAVAIALSRGGDNSIAVGPNSVAVIDAERNKLIAVVPVGVQPGPVAATGDTVLVANLADRTLSRIDPATNKVERTIPLGEIASEIAVKSSVWIALGHPLRVTRLDHNSEPSSVSTTFHNPCAGCSRSMRQDMERRDIEFGASGVAFGDGSLWAVGPVEAASPNPESALMRVDPATGRILATLDWEANAASGLAVGNSTVWIAARGDNAVWRISTRTTEVLDKVTVGMEPSDVAFGDGSAWVTTQGDNSLWRLDASEGRPATVREVIEVGARPSAVVVVPDAVWVANSGDGTVSRIDPSTNRVVATIRIGNVPTAVTVAYGRVWVTIRGMTPT